MSLRRKIYKPYLCCGKSFASTRAMNIHRAQAKTHKEKSVFDTQLEFSLAKDVPMFGLGSAREKPEGVTVFKSGATSSNQLPRFDLIPRVALEILAKRYTIGAVKHGDFNYRKGFHDKAFIIDRINHLVEHLGALLCPKDSDEWDDDNIGAILWAAAFLAEVRQADPLLLKEIRMERSSLV